MSQEKTDLQGLTSQMTQPYVSFDVCRMSNTRKSLKLKLLFKVNKLQLRLTSKIGSISFLQLGNPVGWNIVCYSDATYASFKDGSSQGILSSLFVAE